MIDRLRAMADLKRELVRVGVVGPDWDIHVWGRSIELIEQDHRMQERLNG